MPRKVRNPKVRQDIDVSPALYDYLLWNDLERAMALAVPGESKWVCFDGIGKHDHRTAWAAIESDALLEWVEVFPGLRPANWWRWSAPELRRLMGGQYTILQGVDRCWPTGVPYIECRDEERPLVETQPMFLDRLSLWLPHERVRVPESRFIPEVFSTALTIAPTREVFEDGDEEADK